MLKKTSFRLLLVVILTIISAQILPCNIDRVYAQDSEVNYWAVIIGISEYKYFESELYSDNDAHDLYNELLPMLGESHIKLLIDSAATKAGITDAICNWLVSMGNNDDVVLIFFSGHGFEYSGDYYLVTYDSLLDSEDNDIKDDELSQWLGTLDVKRKVVILDSCHSGGFIPQLSTSDNVILASSRASESSWEFNKFNNSLFSYLVVGAFDNLETVDKNEDLKISAEEIFRYAEPQVVAYSTEYGYTVQHPQLFSGSVEELSLFLIAYFDDIPDFASLAIDGQAYSSNNLPSSFLWLADSTHECNVTPIASTGEIGQRHVFTSWSDGNISPARAISQGGHYTVDYKTQYYLTVTSNYSASQGEGWYYSDSSANISVASPIVGTIIRHVCTGWQGDLDVSALNASIFMNSPKTVIAVWRTDYLYLYTLIGGVGIFIGLGLTLTIVIIRSRRKSKLNLRA